VKKSFKQEVPKVGICLPTLWQEQKLGQVQQLVASVGAKLKGWIIEVGLSNQTCLSLKATQKILPN